MGKITPQGMAQTLRFPLPVQGLLHLASMAMGHGASPRMASMTAAVGVSPHQQHPALLLPAQHCTSLVLSQHPSDALLPAQLRISPVPAQHCPPLLPAQRCASLLPAQLCSSHSPAQRSAFSLLPAGQAASLSPAQHSYFLLPAQHSHPLWPAQHSHSLLPAQHSHSLLPAQHSHSLSPAQHSHSLLPAQHSHSLSPAQHSHSLLPEGRLTSLSPSPHNALPLRAQHCAALAATTTTTSSTATWPKSLPTTHLVTAGMLTSHPTSSQRQQQSPPLESALALLGFSVALFAASCVSENTASARAEPGKSAEGGVQEGRRGEGVPSAAKGEGEGEGETRAGHLTEAFLSDLRAAVASPSQVVLDPDECGSHGRPWNTFHRIAALPDAVVFPESTEEVAAVVRACAAHKVPLVPFGGGTSLEGHILAPLRGISLDMSRMTALVALRPDDLDCTVQAGLGYVELNALLEPHGLFFPLDPGPGASIGGMCATRCSGSLAVRYGTMKDNVISITAVLANGDVIKTAARSRKTAAGYDLTRLLIGSEGTLAVVTEAVLRLQPLPEAASSALCTFPSVADAAECASRAMRTGIQLSRAELMDPVMIRGINLATEGGTRAPFAEAPTLLLEFVGSPSSVAEQAQRVQQIARETGGSSFEYVSDREEQALLWRTRKEALWSAFSLRPGAECMVTDVCVPLSRLAECIGETQAELSASALVCPLVAHAGDGNFHVLILFDPDSAEETEEAKRLNHNLVRRAIAMEGTCTGEHGVGVGKIKFLEEELGPTAVRTMAVIKHALDPNNILNPGKIFVNPFCS